MSYGFGGYPMMGMQNMMSSQMGGPSNNFHQLGSVPQMFENKYGCADCFRDRPYLMPYPKQLNPYPRVNYEPSFFRRLWMNLFGVK